MTTPRRTDQEPPGQRLDPLRLRGIGCSCGRTRALPQASCLRYRSCGRRRAAGVVRLDDHGGRLKFYSSQFRSGVATTDLAVWWCLRPTSNMSAIYLLGVVILIFVFVDSRFGVNE